MSNAQVVHRGPCRQVHGHRAPLQWPPRAIFGNPATTLGLGLRINDALPIVSRFREVLAARHGTYEASASHA